MKACANKDVTGLYTDESPGLKVDPVVVLVLSIVFIFSVVALHSTFLLNPLQILPERNNILTCFDQSSQRSPENSLARWTACMGLCGLRYDQRFEGQGEGREIGPRRSLGSWFTRYCELGLHKVTHF